MCGPQPAPRSAAENRERMNKAFGFFIPTILIGIIGYATWVVVVLVCGQSSLVNDTQYRF